MKLKNEPIIMVNTDNPHQVIDETSKELDGVFKKQRTGFLGFINRLFGGSKEIDEMEKEASADMEEMRRTLKENGIR